MEDLQWLQDQIKAWQDQCPAYLDRAYLEAALELAQKQAGLLERRQGQLDGTAWNPSNW
ncbi:hypothetical protein [Eremococcus coleocola]|uniref:Uncharacterized protein n=1 Tax=Eremococcus coleocola ACS-139-V-Col8 TaxID=908337 RepID=E4KMV2_9LACT|nr:hypothetical protein [Eremococcus coleocola]EFR31730.1 hypothetical protein HMPREF9257_0165 [Eremococcus coleocola ACS-139-V-Col8]